MAIQQSSVIPSNIIGQIGATTSCVPIFQFQPTFEVNLYWWTITGVTNDATNNALASCNVKLFNTSNDVEMATTVSDGSGNFTFQLYAPATSTFYCVAYLAGSPDVCGTTVNTITGS